MSTEDLTSSYQFMMRGGRCGKLMRLMDWQKTLLGSPEIWSPNLKTAISVCLNSRLPIVIWWSEDLVMFYNDACLGILSAKHPEAMGRPGHETWPEVWARLGSTLKSVLQTGEAASVEDQLLILSRNGRAEEAYFTLSHCPIHNEKGAVEGVFTTVSERTQIVLERRLIRTLRDLNKALIGSRSSREVYERATGVLNENPHDFPFTIFYELADHATAIRMSISGNGIPDSIAPEKISLETHDSVWPMERVIQSGHHLLVENVVEVIGRLPSGAWQRPPDKVLIYPILAGGTGFPNGIFITGVNPYCLCDDTHMNFFQLIADQVNDSIGIMIRQAETIRQAQEQSVRADQELEQLRHISNHDLQEPLRKIRTFTNLLHRRWGNKPEGKKYLEKIDHSAAHMSVLIQDVLSYASLSKHDEPFAEVDLNEALKEAIRDLEPLIGQKRAALNCDPLPKIKGIRKQLVLLFKCLLDNALKFNDKVPVIDIRARVFNMLKNTAATDHVEITISDNGIGFDQRYADQTFLIFQRLHNSRFKGNGMGLTLCRKIAENHKGSISVLSEENKGTVFRIALSVDHIDDRPVT